MAIAAQGLTFTWGDATLQEIQTLEITSEAADLQRGNARSGVYFYGPRSIGQLTLTGFSMSGLPQTQLRDRKIMTVTVKKSATEMLTLYTGFARYQGCRVRSAVNGVVLFDFVFTLFGAKQGSGLVTAITP